MSRSYKHYPYIGLSASDKFSKRIVNKGVRRVSKMILATHAEPEYIASCDFPTKDDIMDIYHFSKDDGYDVDPNDEFDQYHYFLNGKLRK